MVIDILTLSNVPHVVDACLRQDNTLILLLDDSANIDNTGELRRYLLESPYPSFLFTKDLSLYKATADEWVEVRPEDWQQCLVPPLNLVRYQSSALPTICTLRESRGDN